MDSQRALGQYMTTNAAYILDGMDRPAELHAFRDAERIVIVEPFVGNGDLLEWLGESPQYALDLYDIDAKAEDVECRNTLMDPPRYSGAYVLTNPPYLARNKSANQAANKAIFDRYGQNDLYKCFIRTLLNDPPDAGLIIIPINFWCSMRAADVALRREFLGQFTVSRINVFEETVFINTTCAVCAVQFDAYTEPDDAILFVVYPQRERHMFTLNGANNYTIGGELYMLLNNGVYTIDRMTAANEQAAVEDGTATNILLRALDNNAGDLIMLLVSAERFVDRTPNSSERTFATLIVRPPLEEAEQEALVRQFNEFLAAARKKYNSMFLANYRESKGIARKRISFSLVYRIMRHLLSK